MDECIQSHEPVNVVDNIIANTTGPCDDVDSAPPGGLDSNAGAIATIGLFWLYSVQYFKNASAVIPKRLTAMPSAVPNTGWKASDMDTTNSLHPLPTPSPAFAGAISMDGLWEQRDSRDFRDDRI
jgi:hypothetical protein